MKLKNVWFVVGFVSALIVICPRCVMANKPDSFCLRHEEQRACFDLALDIQTETKDPILSPASLQNLSWATKDGSYIGTQSHSLWNVAVTLTPREGAVGLSLAIHYAADAIVEREAVVLRLSGNGQAITRALTFVPLNSPLRVDRGTPIMVSAGDLAIVGEAGFVAARYQPAQRRRKALATDVQLILDDRAAHPFSIYPRCLDKLSTETANWTGLEHHRVPKDRLARVGGTTVQARATLYLVDPASSLLPVIVERWEAGAKAAFVVTDHADRTDPQALRAILYGTSDKTAPEYGKKGFFGHGLKLTKTFFASGKRGTLDGDPEVRALAKEIIDAGSEVGSHSITARKDTRDIVEKGLASFDPWQTVTWIDHQPYTNCEALSNIGWDTAGQYGIEDLLVTHGYRWLWTASDMNQWGLQIRSLFGGEPAAAMPVFFPFPPDPRLWVFRSTWFYAPPVQLAAAISDTALTKLEDQRGIFVAHTYLSASAATTHEVSHRRALAVHPTESGALVIDPALDEALARLGARVRAGSLASLTWREAGDRLRALGDVEIRYRSDGTAMIENHGMVDLSGVTLALPVSNAEFVLEGASVLGKRQEPSRSLVWFSLPKKARLSLSATIDGRKIPLLPVKAATLEAL